MECGCSVGELHVFFFNNTATTEIYTLSLHDALPISRRSPATCPSRGSPRRPPACRRDRTPSSSCRTSPGSGPPSSTRGRSEEHTSELQSRQYLVCRLLLEKKNQ